MFMFERFRKGIERSMKVSWREQMTRQDVLVVKEHRERMGLVIKTRWQIMSVLIAYVAALAFVNRSAGQLGDIVLDVFPMAFAVVFILGANTLYQLTYKRLSNLAFLNWAQLLLDMGFVTALVYLSGGATSQLWPLMLLFVIEAAVIIGPMAAWGFALIGTTLLSTVIIGEMSGVIPRYESILAPPPIESGSSLFVTTVIWQAAVLFGMALTANSLVRVLSRHLHASRPNSVIDEETGLFTLPHFTKLVDIELARARRFGQAAHLIVLDIDAFGDFNRRFGIDTGDEVIRRLADCLVDEVRHAGAPDGTSNLVARISGEEFAIFYSESIESETPPDSEDAAILAERIRTRIEQILVDDVGVTVSIGLASCPDDGLELEQLMDQADAALGRAVDKGGNAIETAGEAAAEHGDEEYIPFGDGFGR